MEYSSEVIDKLMDEIKRDSRWSSNQFALIMQAYNEGIDPFYIAFKELSPAEMSELMIFIREHNYVLYNLKLCELLYAKGILDKDYSPLYAVAKECGTRECTYESMQRMLEEYGIFWYQYKALAKYSNKPMVVYTILALTGKDDANNIHYLMQSKNAYGIIAGVDRVLNGCSVKYLETYIRCLNNDMDYEKINTIEDASKLEMVRRAYIKSIDIIDYVIDNDSYQLSAITDFIEAGISPDKYLGRGFDGAQLDMLLCAIKANVKDLPLIANPSYNSIKMAELIQIYKLTGSVVNYCNDDYTYHDLRNIRKDLEVNK